MVNNYAEVQILSLAIMHLVSATTRSVMRLPGQHCPWLADWPIRQVPYRAYFTAMTFDLAKPGWKGGRGSFFKLSSASLPSSWACNPGSVESTRPILQWTLHVSSCTLLIIFGITVYQAPRLE